MDCGLNGLLIGAIAPFDGYRQLLLSLFLVWKKMDVSSEVVWVDGEGASQCNVPMLYFSFARIPAFIGLGLACFLAFIACGTVGVLYLILPEETPVMPILLVVGGGLFRIVSAHHCVHCLEVIVDSIWFKADCD